MNPGTRLQCTWRWNNKPLKIQISRVALAGPVQWVIAWLRWDYRRTRWATWRAYNGAGTLREVICAYREFALGWRGLGDQ